MKRRQVICGTTVHTFRADHGRHTGFSRDEAHPCYLVSEHDGEHRCWTRDAIHKDVRRSTYR